MIFANQCENNSDIVTIDSSDDDMQHFVASQREYFYDNKDELIDKFISENEPTVDELEILDAIKDAIFDRFFLVSRDENAAVIMDEKENLYNIKALNSPFNEIFANEKKYIGLKTALIPYKNAYITDGIYNGFEITKELVEYFDKMPYRNPEIKYNKKNEITMMPLVINFCISTRSDTFLEMEEIVLKKIPEMFTRDFIELFKNEYSYREQLIGAFIRSTDLEKDLNTDAKGKEQFSMIVGGTPTSNYEMYGDNNVIPYNIFDKYYQQKPLSKSASHSVYKKKYKKIQKIFLQVL
ncbi:MAG: hypothetical protein Q9M43_14140 [Sulfurimonas sp.]|nr:hypothetical protein [Sulfurimonas sp.]